MAYKPKTFQLWVFHGSMKWTVTDSFTTLDEAQTRFVYVTNDNAPVVFESKSKAHKKDWSNFSYKIVNKTTGEVLARHIGKCAKYARTD